MAGLLTLPQVRAWLADQGLRDTEVAEVVAGIDVAHPMYLLSLQPGEVIVQYRDRPSAAYPSGALGGRWFALPAVQAEDVGTLGIGHGLAGRSRHEFTVVRQVEALETTALPMSGHTTSRYRGPGGATQIFLPDQGMSSLR